MHHLTHTVRQSEKRHLTPFLLCALLVTGSVGAGRSDATTRPNVLLILLDNIGKDWFRCYGSQEDVTPHIDQLARTGVKYRTFYTTPVCSTTRVALLTGRHPFRTGWHTHHDPAIYGGGYFDWRRETCIARVMKDAGYRTYIAGKWQINDLFNPAQKDAIAQHGFDQYCLFPEGKKGHPAHKKRYWDPYVIENGKRLETQGQYGPEIFTNKLIDFMARSAQEGNQPFFAFYSAILTHLSLGPTPDNMGQQLSDRDQFIGMARYADKLIGRMVTALDDLGIRQNTIIVIATDNGTDNGAYHGYEDLAGRYAGRYAEVGSTMKPKDDGYYPMTDWGINMPLVINCPDRIPGGRESDDLVDVADIFPTIAELGGANLPQDAIIDGRSLAPRLLGKPNQPPWRPWCFSQYHQLRVVRDRRFKLFSDGTLYDLSEDPLESHDLRDSRRLLDDETTGAAHQQLQSVLDQLPDDAQLPWEFRSISARQIEAAKAVRRQQ
jgi:arylsulfatase A-like enzyme